MQIVCDSQAAFDSKECVLAFIYNMYIQAYASHELISFDKEWIFCNLLECYGSGFYFKEKGRLLSEMVKLCDLFCVFL